MSERFEKPIADGGEIAEEFGECRNALPEDAAEAVSAMCSRKRSEHTESTVLPYATPDDLKHELIERVRIMVVNRRPRHPWEKFSDDEILRSAGLYRKNPQTGESGYTLACVLLFGTDEAIISALPYYKTDAVYRVGDTDRYDDRDVVRCNLIESFDRLMTFVEKHTDDRFFMEDEIRVSVRNKLFRELIVNMLIHREYSSAYPARLIVEKNCVRTENGNRARGTGVIDPSDFVPYPKNPVLAAVFREIGWAEELGSGVRNVVKYARIYSGTVPEFVDGDVFRTKVLLNGSRKEDVGANVGVNVGVNVGEELSDTERVVYACIKRDNTIRASEIAKTTGKNQRTAERSIRTLKRLGYIERVGSDKTGSWRILK